MEEQNGMDFAEVDHVVLFDFSCDPSESLSAVLGQGIHLCGGKQVTLLYDVPSAYKIR